MDSTSRDTNPVETRQRLLDTAAAVFAERGFRDATVRAICQRAGVNLASVNYHFGGKETLYVEALRYAYGKALEKYPLDLGAPRGAPAEARLGAFVRAFLLRIFEAGPTAWHGRLVSREMIDPTHALDAIVEERIRPMTEQLSAILRELLGERASPQILRLCAASVVSQCVFYHHCRAVVERLFPRQRFDPQDIADIAAHITAFSLAGLRQAAKALSGKNRRAL